MGLRGPGSRARARTEQIQSFQDLQVLRDPKVHKEIQVPTRLFQVLLVLMVIPVLLVLLVRLAQLVRLVMTARRAFLDLRGLKDPQAMREQLERKGYRVTSVPRETRAIRVMLELPVRKARRAT